MTRALAVMFLAGTGALLTGVSNAAAEPMFLAKQEARCTTCHYSPTGGGLLTPYGRLHSRELSTTGASADDEGFLWGVLGDALGPVQLGIDVRPSHLRYSSDGIPFSATSVGVNILMNADLLGAYQTGAWTLYGQIGRRPEIAGGDLYSYEHWGGRRLNDRWSVRFGRFFPAYGVRFADHTSLNRASLGFDKYDQVYGAEVSYTSARSLVHMSGGPGKARSVLEESGRQAFTTSGRVQFDLDQKNVVVASGIFRTASDRDVRNGSGGIAYGFAPVPRVTVWTQADAQFSDDPDGSSFVLVNETSFEAIRGLWLKVSPQLQTEAGTRAGLFRMKFEADLLPRTHWHGVIAYYRDRLGISGVVSYSLLAQLHLYL